MQGFRRLAVVLAIVLTFGVVIDAFADVPAAEAYLAEAQALREGRDFAGAGKKLELAEAELDEVAPAEKATLIKQIAAARAMLDEGQLAGDKQKYKRELDNLLRQLESSIGNLVTWPGEAAQFRELASNPRAKAALGADLEQAQAKFATFQKLHAKKASSELGAALEADMQTFETEWAEAQPKLTSGDDNQAANAARDIEQSIDGLNRRMQSMAADDPKAVAAKARLKTIAVEMNRLSGDAGAIAVVTQLKRSVDLYASEWQSWQEETAPATWDQFLAATGGPIDRFNAPKSVEAWRRLDSILKDARESEGYKSYQNSAAVTAQVGELQKQHDAAYANVLKSATSVVAGAEAAAIDQRASETYGRLRDDLSYGLGETFDAQALIARVAALEKKHSDTVTGAAKTSEEALAKLTTAADKAWPAMVAKFGATDGFDPGSAKSGGYYRVHDGANRMGWDFKPENGGFDFAMEARGQAVAGNYSPAVKAAIAEVQKKTGRDIDDSGWDYVMLYTGKQGKVQQFREGSIETTSGQEVGTYRETVATDAPIVEIVALRVGPLAVAQGQGVVNEDGSMSAIGGPARSAGRGWMARIYRLTIGLTAALACLIIAGFTPLTTLPQLNAVTNGAGRSLFAIVGIGCALLGTFWLLGAVWSLSPLAVLFALVVMAAGAYAAMEFLGSSGVVKPELASKIRPFGIPIGLACVLLSLVSLFT